MKAKRKNIKIGGFKVINLEYPRTRNKEKAEKLYNKLKKLKYKPQM